MYQNTSQETVRLSHDDTALIGKYSEGVGTVVVELYSDVRAFSVQLPSFATEYQTQFLFKNLGANAVTLNTLNNEIINQSGVTSHVVSASEFYSLLSNGVDRWISLDNHLYTSGPVVFGTPTDNMAIDATGHITFSGAARPWRDQIGDIVALQQTGTGVSINTTEVSVEFTTLANLSDFLYTNVQLNHDKDISSEIHPHIHFWQANNNAPNFLLQYRWHITGTAKTTAWTNLKCNSLAFSYVSGTLNQIAYSLPITVPTGAGLSDIVQFKILRDNANTSGIFTGADPYTGTVGLTSFDVHFMLNSFGSTDEFIK